MMNFSPVISFLKKTRGFSINPTRTILLKIQYHGSQGKYTATRQMNLFPSTQTMKRLTGGFPESQAYGRMRTMIPWKRRKTMNLIWLTMLKKLGLLKKILTMPERMKVMRILKKFIRQRMNLQMSLWKRLKI